MKKQCFVIMALLLTVMCLSAQEVALRKAWKMDFRGLRVRTADNCVIALWEDTDAGDTDIYAQKFNPSGVAVWTQPLIIVDKPGVQEAVACVPTSDNNFVLLYQQSGHGYEAGVWLQKFSSNGQCLWGESGVCIRSGSAYLANACLVPNSVGGVYALYPHSSNGYAVIGQNLDSFGNQLWPSGGLTLTSNPNFLSLDGAVSDGEGGIIINFTPYQGTSNLIRFSPQGTVVGNNPMLVHAGIPGGRFSIVESSEGNYLLYGYRGGAIILQRMNNQGELLLPTPVQIQLQIYSALYYPKLRLAPLADGGIILAWEVRNDNTHSELRAIRLDSDFNSLWGPNGVQIASGDTQNWVFRELNLSVTDTGAAWLCWNESLNDEVSYNLKAQYLSPAGDLPWGVGGITINAGDPMLSGPVAQAFADRCMFLWADQRDMSNALRLQVLSTGGAAFQDLGGEAQVTRLAGIACISEVFALQDRYLVLWSDLRGSGFELYYQICDTNMNPLLEEGGRPLCPSLNKQVTNIRTVKMPDNSVAIVYTPDYDGTQWYPLHLQRIDAEGNTMYPGHGLQVNDNYSIQDTRISACGNDIYVVWTVGGYPQFHLMGQKISNGQTQWGPSGKALYTPPEQMWLGVADLVENYVVFNTKDYSNDYSTSRVLRIDPNGDPAPGWPAEGVAVVSVEASIDGMNPGTALLGNDLVVFCTTHDQDYQNYSFLAQRIGPDGSRLWSETGIELPFTGIHSMAVSDNAIDILYSSAWDPGVQDLRLQKLLGDGSLLYEEGGRLIATGLRYSYDATLVRFANGNLASLWSSGYDNPYSYKDVFIRHINSQGEALGAGPEILCSEWLEQEHVRAAAIGNSALVCWDDGRAGVLDNEYFVNSIYGTRVNSGSVDISDVDAPALDTAILRQNYPNPFNPSTTLQFSLPTSGKASLDIYNLKGQRIKSICSDLHLTAGNHSFPWDGRNEQGEPVASGIYFSRLRYNGSTLSRKMVLMK